MAINLLGNYNLGTNPDQSVISSSSATSVRSDASTAALLMQQIRNLVPGQIIEGKLMEKDGENIRLLLGNDLLLNTTVESDVNIEMGQSLSFEVKNNKEGQLLLRPLFTNTGNEATAVKALDAAQINATKETIDLVNGLMKEGMSIKKEDLQLYNREMNDFPKADVNDIISLHKLGLPVNETNLTGINMYNNNNRWMIDNINDFAKNFTNAIAETAREANEGDLNNLTKLIDGLKQILGEAPDKAQAAAENVTGQEKIVISEDGAQETVKETITPEKAQAAGEKYASENEAVRDVFDKLKDLDPRRIGSARILEHVKEEITSLLKERFLMDPQKVEDKEYIKDYYNRMYETGDKLEKLFEQIGKPDSAASNQAALLKDNMSFMNQVNDLYNYIQLPLKMADSQANGDLYVYAKKRGKNEEGEPLTALLHLSMETLGNMDIFLKLDAGKLSTKFCLEKEEMIDFIEAHIDELNARLIEKGYNIDTQVGKMDDVNRNIVDDIRGESSQIRLLSTQTFDARA